MRLSTRFGLGAALAVLPLLGVVIYSAERMQGLAQSNERIAMRQLVGTRMSAGVIRRIERLEEYQRKFIVSEDHGYAAKFVQTIEATNAELDALWAPSLSDDEIAAASRLREAWSHFVDHSRTILWATEADRVAEEFARLLELADGVQVATRHAAAAEVEAAAEVRQEVRTTATVVTGIALILSITLILWAVRSLRTRLDHFVLGTIAVSKGAFSFQLEARDDDELGEVARAFNRMVDALRQLERMKADFISSVSHELKTPLVAMLETNDLLLEEVPGPLTARQERMIRLNTQAAQRLSKMIGDLLELSRIKAELRYDMSTQDLAALAETAVGELEALALERDVTLELSLTSACLPIECDPDRMVQIVQNLLENALKYTPPGGTIVVTAHRYPGNELPEPVRTRLGLTPRACTEVALLCIEDSGPGIPPEDRERVFEKFFRRQGQPAAGSVGLGLAICREIVEAHHGAIWVADGVLGGTSMRITLPLGSPQRRREGSR